jgi:TetR/AcrR family transcriptional regulator, repressor for neighboring sulfatase
MRPGPRRPRGAPTGPEDVRQALLDAAAQLFGESGVDAVSLRDIARAANVQVALIARYIGSRQDLVLAVFDELSAKIGREVLERPLEQISFERESPMGQWTRVLLYLASAEEPVERRGFNPVEALAKVIQEEYGLDETTAMLRGAQITASALGWRLFEDYLIAAGDLASFTVQELRDELTRSHRRLGATPYPSPPDPPRRS